LNWSLDVQSAAQTWSGKGKQQVVTTPIVSSGKGDASVPHTQVVRQVRKQLAALPRVQSVAILELAANLHDIFAKASSCLRNCVDILCPAV
jgi:hypothetical protein